MLLRMSFTLFSYFCWIPYSWHTGGSTSSNTVTVHKLPAHKLPKVKVHGFVLDNSRQNKPMCLYLSP